MNTSFLQYAIGIAYIFLGLYVYRYQSFVIPLDKMIATSLAILITCYGVFRIARAFVRNKKDEN